MKAEFGDEAPRARKQTFALVSALLVVAGSSIAQAGPATVSAAAAFVDSHAVRPARAVTPNSAALLRLSPPSLSLHNQAARRSFEPSEKLIGQQGDPDMAISQGDALTHRFPIKWQSTPANLDARVVTLARNFRRNGLPIVRLWGSGRNLLAVGLNPRGVPGIYFTQNVD